MSLKMTVSNELRPCIVNGKEALFHRWEEKREIVSPSYSLNGHGGGTISVCLAIVEMNDGKIYECYPKDVRFVDNKHSQYFFDNEEE